MGLTKERNTPMREGDFLVLPVAPGEIIYAGALVAVDINGYARPAINTAEVRAVGRAEETVDNRMETGGTITVRRGVFKWQNDYALPVMPGMVYEECFIRDDETVRAHDDSGPNPLAGRVIEVTDDGVWVETR